MRVTQEVDSLRSDRVQGAQAEAADGSSPSQRTSSPADGHDHGAYKPALLCTIDLDECAHMCAQLVPEWQGQGATNPGSALAEAGLPINSVLLELADGVYCSAGLADTLRRAGLFAPPPLPAPPSVEQMALSKLAKAAARVVELQAALRREREATQQAKLRVAELLRAQEEQRKQRANLALIRETVRKQKAAAEQGRLAADTAPLVLARSLYPCVAARVDSLSESSAVGSASPTASAAATAATAAAATAETESDAHSTAAVRAATAAARAACLEDSRLLSSTLSLLEGRRMKLVAQAYALYPITVAGAPPVLRIRGLPLPPQDMTGFEEELVSTALGYACHLTFLVSKYLEIPLRYSLHYAASRSYVRDDVAPRVAEYPLYWRGADRQRFARGVHYLHKDVIQLLHSFGLQVQADVPLLGCLRHLLHQLLFLDE